MLLARRREKDFSIDNLLVRIRSTIEMMWWTGLAPWEFGVRRNCVVIFIARRVDLRLPGKRNSNSPGARPVHQIILMMDQ